MLAMQLVKPMNNWFLDDKHQLVFSMVHDGPMHLQQVIFEWLNFENHESFLNQARASRKLAYAWFLKITSVRKQMALLIVAFRLQRFCDVYLYKAT